MKQRPPALRLAIGDGVVVDGFAGGGGASTGIEEAIGRPVDIAINHDAAAIACHRANHPDTQHYLTDIWGVVVDWARKVKPGCIVVENVDEFRTWGPLNDDGYPVKSRAGETFAEWLATLRSLGYDLEFRTLVAADYGAPTIRKRLYLVARLDGHAPAFPTPTHGVGRANPWVPAHQVIDWSLACPSIFERKRPLAEATMRRIAAGLRRYVVEAEEPFLVGAVQAPSLIKYHGGRGLARGQSLGDPLRTADGSNRFALMAPSIVPITHTGANRAPHRVDEPMRTITSANRGELALAAPYLAPLNGEHGHASPRARSVKDPAPTVMATSAKHVLCAPALLRHYGGEVGQEIERPLGTVTGKDHHAVAAAWLERFYGSATSGRSAELPLPTITAGGGRAGGHIAEVRAFLVKYYSAAGNNNQQQSLFDPLHTVTSKARMGLVTIHGQDYQIVDIGMRMLQPRELFAAQGFPEDYVITPEVNGRPITKTAQIQLAGNSVCPDVAAAIVRANLEAA